MDYCMLALAREAFARESTVSRLLVAASRQDRAELGMNGEKSDGKSRRRHSEYLS